MCFFPSPTRWINGQRREPHGLSFVRASAPLVVTKRQEESEAEDHEGERLGKQSESDVRGGIGQEDHQREQTRGVQRAESDAPAPVFDPDGRRSRNPPLALPHRRSSDNALEKLGAWELLILCKIMSKLYYRNRHDLYPSFPSCSYELGPLTTVQTHKKAIAPRPARDTYGKAVAVSSTFRPSLGPLGL